jgi:hypothetical protein
MRHHPIMRDIHQGKIVTSGIDNHQSNRMGLLSLQGRAPRTSKVSTI